MRPGKPSLGDSVNGRASGCLLDALFLSVQANLTNSITDRCYGQDNDAVRVVCETLEARKQGGPVIWRPAPRIMATCCRALDAHR